MYSWNVLNCEIFVYFKCSFKDKHLSTNPYLELIVLSLVYYFYIENITSVFIGI